MKPSDLFDRNHEWNDLSSFIDAEGEELQLGIVSGRRRVGKSYLLRRVAREGLYYQAIEEERTPALRRLGDFVGKHRGLAPGMLTYDDWATALDDLLHIAAGAPIVIDELPYLIRHSPELLSSLQLIHDNNRSTRGRLLLCGSSVSIMDSLLTGSEPLRGRATLDMRIKAFDYRVARKYWAIDDLTTAISVHAIIGGSPGYRDLANTAAPQSLSELEPWLGKTLFNPSHALYREDEYLLREEPRITQRSLYQSILSTIAAGERTPSRIGTRIGRDRTAISALLNVLTDGGFVRKEEDLLNQRASVYVLTDPILRFSRLLLEPNRMHFDERRWTGVWQDFGPTWRSQIMGPHLEDIAREWVTRYASTQTLGCRPSRVGRATVTDKSRRTRIELDLAGKTESGVLGFIGEVKATKAPCDIDQIERLDAAKVAIGSDARDARLLLVSLGGFTERLRIMATSRGDIELVDLERLYEGE